jgi:hypothetical protein
MIRELSQLVGGAVRAGGMPRVAAPAHAASPRRATVASTTPSHGKPSAPAPTARQQIPLEDFAEFGGKAA